MAQDRRTQNLHIKGHIELVVCQIKGQYEVRNDQLRLYHDLA